MYVLTWCARIIDISQNNIDKYGFSREFKFEVFAVDYVISWFKNQSTLICGDLRVMFHKAYISNTWPSPAGCKMKIQFYDEQRNCVAVIPISYHRDEEYEQTGGEL